MAQFFNIPPFRNQDGPEVSNYEALRQTLGQAAALSTDANGVGVMLPGVRGIRPATQWPIIGKIVSGGTSGVYTWNWNKPVESDGGTAVEINGDTGIPVGTVVELWPTAQGDRLIFQSRRCGGPPHILPGCPCSIPGTIYLHCSAPPTGLEDFIVPATLTYGAKPAALSSYNTDPTGYYSTASHTTFDGNYTVWYWFGCSGGLYFLQLLFDPSSGIGYPGRGFVVSWRINGSSNQCTPFSLTSAASNSSGYLAQGITINETP